MNAPNLNTLGTLLGLMLIGALAAPDLASAQGRYGHHDPGYESQHRVRTGSHGNDRWLVLGLDAAGSIGFNNEVTRGGTLRLGWHANHRLRLELEGFIGSNSGPHSGFVAYVSPGLTVSQNFGQFRVGGGAGVGWGRMTAGACDEIQDADSDSSPGSAALCPGLIARAHVEMGVDFNERWGLTMRGGYMWSGASSATWSIGLERRFQPGARRAHWRRGNH